jgi:(1->4)-alpha-D-glucan 1-alpha-D-glucosylmutase
VTLAEIPSEWSQQVVEWNQQVTAESAALGDRNLEYLLYQMLIGSWPVSANDAAAPEEFRERIQAAMLKSARESRAHTSWSAPDKDFENALQALIEAVFHMPIRDSIEKFALRIAAAGMRNSLVQTVLKLTAPGVPDIYQGAELWELSLVDPDNRRPVDYGQRAALLERVDADWRQDPAATLRRLATNWRDGGIKLLLTSLLLGHRREHANLYERGAYRAFDVPEPFAAFVRESEAARLLVVLARYPLVQPQADARLTLPPAPSGWLNLLTNAPVPGDIQFSVESQGLPLLLLVSQPALNTP